MTNYIDAERLLDEVQTGIRRYRASQQEQGKSLRDQVYCEGAVKALHEVELLVLSVPTVTIGLDLAASPGDSDKETVQ